MNIVENEQIGRQVEPGAKRTRKIAVGHHANDLLLDANGNTRTFQRLDSVSEIMPALSRQCTVNDDNDNHERNSKIWESTVLQQIQVLIRNVQVSESLADFINKEILNDTDVNANIGHRLRRKSCFSLNNDLHSQPSRRQSVTSFCQNKSKSLPRTNLNNNGPNDLKQFPQGRRNSVVHNNGHRPSYAGQTQCRRSSVTSQYSGRRSSVVNHVNPNVHVTGPSSRRNSVAHFGRRRSSLAHAYQHSAIPPFRRMSSVNDNLVPMSTNAALQRRRSSVKAPCFPVTKISSVQKRLHRIYNRRQRRQDRRQVNIADVKKAFKGLKKGEDAGTTSESEDIETHSNDCASGSTSEMSDGNSNESEEENTSVTKLNGTESVLHADNSEQDIDKRIIDNGNELKPNPRRKTSIQVRSWELSRRLRQRRREKRKGFTESDLI